MIPSEFIILSAKKKIELETLHLEYFSPLTPTQWQSFEKAIAQCPALKSLKVSSNDFQLSNSLWIPLSKALANNQALEQLDLSGLSLGQAASHYDRNNRIDVWQDIKKLLIQCPKLTSLDLSGNDLREIYAHTRLPGKDIPSSFRLALTSCPALTSLSLGNNNLNLLSEEKWYELSEVLSQLPALKSLNLRDNYLWGPTQPNSSLYKRKSTQVFNRVLAHCPELTSLDISKNCLANADEAYWSNTCNAIFKGHGVIKSLNLSANYLFDMTGSMWTIFCKELAKSSELVYLNLDDNELNKISEARWEALCQALAKCTALKCLSLAKNNFYEISELRWEVLGRSLAQCPRLTTLNISENNLSELGYYEWRGIGQLLHKCKGLTNLLLSNNQLDRLYLGYSLSLFWPSPWTAFAQAIEKSSSLVNLDCDDFGGERGNTIKNILMRNAEKLNETASRSRQSLPVDNVQSPLIAMAYDESESSFIPPLAVAFFVETYDQKEPSAPPAYLVNR